MNLVIEFPNNLWHIYTKTNEYKFEIENVLVDHDYD